jgi:hypothetical protein
MKKKTVIIISILSGVLVTAFAVFGAIVLFKRIFPGEYVVEGDETALYITLELDEDIGLIVYDYTADGRGFSGGVSNADRSMIKRDDVIINVWNKEQLECDGETVDLTFKFRIITEYIDPNYENVYPVELTRYIDPVSLRAEFGNAYKIVISGGKESGYKALVAAP